MAAQQGVSIRTIVADLENYPIEPDTWDVVVLTFAHLEPGLRKRVHRAAARALRPAGALVLEAYTPEQVELGTGGPPTPERLITLDDLRTELSGLRFEVGREVRRELSEGSAHNGVSAVVQVLAFKPSQAGSDLRRSES